MGMQIVVPEHEGFVVAGARGQPIRGLVFRCADAFAREAELIEDRHPHEGLQAAHPPARVGDKLEREIVFGGNPLAAALYPVLERRPAGEQGDDVGPGPRRDRAMLAKADAVRGGEAQ